QVGATAGSEPFRALGDNAQTDPLYWNWQLGSGATTDLTATDAGLSNAANLLTNSSFETFTVANTPDNCAILTGAAAPTIFAAGAGNGFAGATSPNALKYTGNGSELTSIAQTFAQTSGGTPATLLPDTVYGINFWAKKTAGAVAGALAVDLVDGSNTVVNDDAGTANTIAVANGSLTTG